MLAAPAGSTSGAKITGKEAPMTEPIEDGDVLKQIVLDIGNDTPPDESPLKYGPNELEFRRGVEQRFAAYRQQHPDAILDIKD